MLMKTEGVSVVCRKEGGGSGGESASRRLDSLMHFGWRRRETSLMGNSTYCLAIEIVCRIHSKSYREKLFA